MIPPVVVAPLYFQGKIQLGVVSQSSGAFNHILNDLSIIVNRFEGISQFAAGIGRLGNFVETMEAKQRDAYASSGSAADISSDPTRQTLASTYSSGAAAGNTSSWDRVTWWDAFKTAASISGIDRGDPSPFGDVLAAAARELVPLPVAVASGGNCKSHTSMM